MEAKLQNDWSEYLSEEFTKPYFEEIKRALSKEQSAGKIVYPKEDQIFRAFQLTELADVKIVIMGQDPYHGINQANGLSFSVSKGEKLPPSLLNIYKEIESEFNLTMSRRDGDLTHWARQGVLLLNSSLTVRANEPASHNNIGWQFFTDEVLRILNNENRPMVFMLWGKHAQGKKNLLHNKQHLVLLSSHPSPLSAYRGFFGCNHFISANNYLLTKNQMAIDWRIA